MNTLRTFFWVGVGGFIGANLRYMVGTWVDTRWHAAGFPVGTFVVNVTGAFVLGFLATLLSEVILSSPHARLLLTVGMLGAYTTFSTFSYESVKLLEEGSGLLALVNMVGSVVAGAAAVWMGIVLARAMFYRWPGG